MSALVQKQTFGPKNAMSALPLKADIDRWRGEVRFVPKADISARSRKSAKPFAGAIYWEDAT